MNYAGYAMAISGTPENGVIAYDDQAKAKPITYAGSIAKNVQVLTIGYNKKLGLLQLGPKVIDMIYCKTPYITRCNEHKKESMCHTKCWLNDP